MSAFLGKIHYWLYNKIIFLEDINDDILSIVDCKEFDIELLISESYKKFGEKIEGNLEDKINHDNIHGWLQDKIKSVELRHAYYVTVLIGNNIITLEEIYKVFENKAIECSKNLETPNEIFNEIYNYLLSGMPCDRVNTIVKDEDDEFVWEVAIDVHKTYWDMVGGNVEFYNGAVKKWIETFVKQSSKSYVYNNDGGINRIKRR